MASAAATRTVYGVSGRRSSWWPSAAWTTSLRSPYRLVSSAPMAGWPPSISWSAALPMSCRSPQRRPRAPSRPISSAIMPGQVGDLDRVLQHVLRVAGAELEPAEVVEQLLVQARRRSPPGRRPGRAGGCAAPSPPASRLTISSIRVGWIRPSWISFSSASLAISRRMLSKPVTMTMPGVSSTITSTPVAFSKARMFRPFAADDPPLHVVGRDVDGADGGLGGVRRRRSAGSPWRGSRGPSAGRSRLSICSCLRISAADLVPEVVLERARAGASRASSGPSWAIRWSGSRCSARICLTSCVAAVELLLLLGQVALDRSRTRVPCG